MNTLKIEETHDEQALVFHFNGRLDSITSDSAHEQIDKRILEGYHHILFDFEKLNFLSTAGIRVLLIINAKIEALHGTLTISHPNEDIMRILKSCQADQMLQIQLI